MKNLKLLLTVFIIFVISALYSCGGGNSDEALKDSSVVSDKPVIEQTVDSTATADTLKK